MMHQTVLVFSLLAGVQSQFLMLEQFFAGPNAIIGVIAQSTTSLYIPSFDSQPIDAQIIGVDSSGHTSWAISPGSVTADDEQGFVGTFTLVEGSDSVHLSYADSAESFTVNVDCALASNQAVCTASADGTVTTVTETVNPIAVALVSGTAASASTTSSSSNSGTNSSPAPSQTGSTQNSANRLGTPFVSLLGAIGFMLIWL
ncbi:hypothetical protein GYMLUDRAFT_45889 [Collybiopsis luxurians FD-317 M1]|uniref:Uncharacterized protein n=1 Tax=Collybiopsis luxurians FD-317 M1 TaxID=944289 RepID=A0A0D0C5D9_9AGAR|nr:hypothetical protein GYMLUDRAFT_45889 [Collybiopsis luxurians FD-317 M1]